MHLVKFYFVNKSKYERLSFLRLSKHSSKIFRINLHKSIKKQLIKKIKINCTAIFQYNRIFIKAHIIDLIKIKDCTKPIFNLSNSTILISEPIRNLYTDLNPIMFCYFLNS